MKNKENKLNKTYIIIAIIIAVAVLGFGAMNYVSSEKNRQIEQIKIQEQAEIKNRQASDLNECLNAAQNEKERLNGETIKLVQEDRDGKYNLGELLDDINKLYERDRENCIVRYK